MALGLTISLENRIRIDQSILAVGTPVSKGIDTDSLCFGDLTIGRFGPVSERSDNFHAPLIGVDPRFDIRHSHRGRDDALF